VASSLEARNIRKEYPGTVALDDISLRFDGGRVYALLGKNGAGKSTLVKILAGTVQPTSGEILINGKPITLRSATDAFAQGIATVYQELSLIPELSIAENILLGRLPHKTGALRMIIDWPAARAQAKAVLDEMGVHLDVRRKVAELGVAQQQVVEIAKAMSFKPAVLMLDEPTSALARHETEMLFRIIRRLAKSGVAVIHITHRLQELAQIADVVTVLRDGKFIGSAEFNPATPESIVHMMFGAVVQKQRPADLKAGTEPLLEVQGLSRGDKFRDIDFTLHRGEILGIAGMLGSGRTELLRAIFGADPIDAGRILLDGKAVRPAQAGSPKRMMELGLGFIPENRKEQALVLGQSIRTNLCLASMNRVGWCGLITSAREQRTTLPLIERLAIKVADAGLPIDSLSGGNQQKIVVAKWLNTKPRVILFDEPTRGIDVQAKQHIFQIMWDLSREGIGSIFVSSELEELVEVCHRILIMKSGAIAGEVSPDQITVDELVVRCMETSTVDPRSAA